MPDLEQRLRDALRDDAQRARLVNPDRPVEPRARPLPVTPRPGRLPRRLVAVAAAVALVAAMGVAVIQDRDRPSDVTTSSDATQVPRPDARDQAIADGAVLRPDDVPRGWEPAPPADEAARQAKEDDLDQAFARCLGIDVSELEDDGPTATSAFVRSPEENDEQVVSTVTVFSSNAEVRARVDRFRDEVAQRCYLDVKVQQIVEAAAAGITTAAGRSLSGADVEIGDATIEEVSLEYCQGLCHTVGAHDGVALRLTVPLTSEGIEVPVYAVVAFVGRGRALVQMTFQTFNLPFGRGSTSAPIAPQDAALLTNRVLNRIAPGL
jgi:hypothetical protein